mgnify:CR=1 FL=1
MFRVKLKGPIKEVMDVVSGLREKVLTEVYVVVNGQDALLELVQKSISVGVAVEIVPEVQVTSNPAKETPATKATPTDKKSDIVSQPEEESSEDIIKKYKKKKENSTEKPAPMEAGETKKEPTPLPKPESPVPESPKPEPKPEPAKVTTITVGTEEKSKAEEERKEEKKKTETKSKNVPQQSEESGELSFDEWVKLKEESFSRKLLE